MGDAEGEECDTKVTGAIWSPCPENLLSWLSLTASVAHLAQPCVPAGPRPGPRRGQLKEWPSENLPDSWAQTTPSPQTHILIKHTHAKNAASLRCKNSRVSFLTPTNPRGSVADLSSSRLQKTITISGLMHICHARRMGRPDGHDTVAGASTNVCGCPCCYLYHSETQARKYLQKDSGARFCWESNWSRKINRWD